MKKLLTYSFLLLTVCAFAQQQYTFTNYTQEQGLPSGTIRGIFRDITGYIWFTSEGSLARFDGIRINHTATTRIYLQAYPVLLFGRQHFNYLSTRIRNKGEPHSEPQITNTWKNAERNSHL